MEEATTAKRTRRPRRDRKTDAKQQSEPVSEVELAALHKLVSTVVIGFSMMAPPRYKPTMDEVNNIFIPAEKIYLRHFGMPKVSEETSDVTALGVGVMNYVFRVSGILERPVGSLFGHKSRQGASQSDTYGQRAAQDEAKRTKRRTVVTPPPPQQDEGSGLRVIVPGKAPATPEARQPATPEYGVSGMDVPPGLVPVPGVGFMPAEGTVQASPSTNGNGTPIGEEFAGFEGNVDDLPDGARMANPGENLGPGVAEQLQGDPSPEGQMFALWQASQSDDEE